MRGLDAGRHTAQIADNSRELVLVDWLCEIRSKPGLKRSLTIVRSRERCHSYSRNSVAARTNAPHELVPVYSRHRDVRDDHTDALHLKCLQRRFGRVTLKHRGAALLEQRGNRLAGIALVVDHENRQIVQPDRLSGRTDFVTGAPHMRRPGR